MRWGCPHCGTQLAIPDDKLESTWSFSRCYKCNGFSLVKKSEINLIKVDRAPSGESILLPEGTETPLQSRDTQKRLAETQTVLKPKPQQHPQQTGAAVNAA